MKIMIQILNAITLIVIPLIFVILILSPLTLSIPGAKVFLFSIVFVPILIFFSNKYHSILLAVIALIPFVILTYLIIHTIVSTGTKYKKEFDTAKKDFICNENLFINVENDPRVGSIRLYKKNNPYSYSIFPLGRIFRGEKIEIDPSGSGMTHNEVLSCKNAEGNSITEVYIEIPQDQVGAFIESLN